MEEAVSLSESAPVEDGSQDTNEEEGYVIVTGFVGNELELCFIKSFFSGLDIVDVCFCIGDQTLHRKGQVVVKFRSREQAAAALEYSHKDGKDILVEGTDENKWTEAVQQAAVCNKFGKQKSRRKQRQLKAKERLAGVADAPSFPPRYVHLLNLPYSMTKQDVKLFIGKKQMADTEITFFLDKGDFHTKEAFVMLPNKKQMQDCLKLHKKVFDDRTVYILPSSKVKFQETLKNCQSEKSNKPQKNRPTPSKKTSKGNSKLKCMYVRNFPAQVTKLDIQQFFAGFNVNLEDIFLLYGNDGTAMGEALVKFSTEHVAMFAESLHRRNFLGTEILLLRISEEQMNDFDGVRI